MAGHPADREAAAYLAGVLPAGARERLDEHLLSCEDCWRAMQQARAGRSALERAREVAPAALRDRVRSVVDLEAGRPVPRRRAAPYLAVAAVVVAVAALLLPPVLAPDALEHAVRDYAVRELPGTAMAAQSAPDLSGLRLEAVGAGAGTYDGLPVDGYAYTDAVGRRVVLYLSRAAFPEPSSAEPVPGHGPAWVAHEGDVVVLCAALPAPGAPMLLVLGQDEGLVMAAGRALGAV